MRYARARERQEQETTSYRAYVTDTLMYYGENKRVTERWLDRITPKPLTPPEDPRPCKEIADNIWKRIRGD